MRETINALYAQMLRDIFLVMWKKQCELSICVQREQKLKTSLFKTTTELKTRELGINFIFHD